MKVKCILDYKTTEGLFSSKVTILMREGNVYNIDLVPRGEYSRNRAVFYGEDKVWHEKDFIEDVSEHIVPMEE